MASKLFLTTALLAVAASFTSDQRAALSQTSAPLSRLGAADKVRLGARIAEGIMIVEVMPSSLAQELKLNPYDFIYEINEAKITSYEDLQKALDAITPGAEIKVGFNRYNPATRKVESYGMSAVTRATGAQPQPIEPPIAAPAQADTATDADKDAEIVALKRLIAEILGRSGSPNKQPVVAQPVARPVVPTVAQVRPPDIPATLPRLAPLKPMPRTVSGRVINRSGKPVAGVAISVYGTSAAGKRIAFFPKTNEQGVYSTPVPDGTYYTYAEVKTNYNGQTYRFPLHPLDGDDDTTQNAGKGIIEDYVWRLSGLKPGESEDDNNRSAYYGSRIEGQIADIGPYVGDTNGSNAARDRAEFPQGFRIDLTFTPDGHMPDGLPGQVFSVSKTYKLSPGYSPFSDSFDLLDVPTGRYTLSARLTKPDGQSKDLLLTTRVFRPLQTPALTQTLDFAEDSTSAPRASIRLYLFPIKEQ